MSVIFITHHDENIYNFDQRKESENFDNKCQAYKKHPGWDAKSSQRQDVKLYACSNRKPHATMGLPHEELPNPADYLKKHTGKPSYSEQPNKNSRRECQKKPKLFPTKEEIEEYNKRKEQAAQADKNFVVKNIKTVLRMKPKVPERKMVLERHGESKPMTAGLEPIYITQDMLGKTPKYLRKFIKQKEQLRQMNRDTAGVEQPQCKYITREEREILLTGLKHNWAELQMQYQGLPILTDTIPKKNRKSKLEAELKQLEKDIVLIERHPYIYVYDDNAAFN